MVAAKAASTQTTIPVLVADDSIVFRRYLRDIMADNERIVIAGEAKNGIEALDLVLKLRPRVILMDMEMPLMDGMTALQHLMIHCPTPTIMFSSLTSEGTFRAFDALKNGAVDFFSKDALFDESRQDLLRKLISRKILDAAEMSVRSIEPAFDINIQNKPEKPDEPASRVVFCEECGGRNVVTGAAAGPARCNHCGDILVEYHEVEIFRRNSHVTVFGGGEDCYRNLLNIIPKISGEINGSVIIVIQADTRHVDTFTEYLDSISPMKVLRAREGMNLEGGYCYVAATRDQISLQQFSAQQTLVRIRKLESGMGAIDLVMGSVAAAFRRKCCAVLLSGNDFDGIRGISEVVAQGGEALVLKPSECLSPRLALEAKKNSPDVRQIADESEMARTVMECCRLAGATPGSVV